MLKTTKRQGFSLLEMMLGISIGAVVIAGVLTAFMASNKANIDTIKGARLTHELRTVMRLITDDLRRAGYWANALSDLNTSTNTNPFMQTTAPATDIVVNSAGNCITFSYDRSSDGTIPAIGNAGGDERFGYRLSNSAVQSRPDTLSTLSCTDGASTWDNLTDPKVVEVTNFSIVPSPMIIDLDSTGAGTATVTIRNYTINLTGRLVSDPTVTRTLTQKIRVRNDKFTP